MSTAGPFRFVAFWCFDRPREEAASWSRVGTSLIHGCPVLRRGLDGLESVARRRGRTWAALARPSAQGGDADQGRASAGARGGRCCSGVEAHAGRGSGWGSQSLAVHSGPGVVGFSIWCWARF
ncbi:hypothetical protein NL676_018054 [Syzygium grande]|nr:hypothetical protein NL676_018054 [Syzygium grande]